MTTAFRHQYVERHTESVQTEKLYSDAWVRFLYSGVREKVPVVFKAVTGPRMSKFLGFVSYDMAFGSKISRGDKFLKARGVDLSECLDDPRTFKTAREIFERKIRYWDCRPMPADPAVVVSPADARVVIGSLCNRSLIFAKDKFFGYDELLGTDKAEWLAAFERGSFAVFRLTPDKYHYNHTPVAGEVVDYYALDGSFHSCHPDAVVRIATPYSKNRRVVTIVDTDVPGGTGVGLVAMIEVVALMIGDVVQCYSARRYESPVPMKKGLFVERGQPKSLYRPGSSTDIVLFEHERVDFAGDLVRNLRRSDAASRFSTGFGSPLVETDVAVRSEIGRRKEVGAA